jgi:iron complex transport system permease protein
MQPSQSQLSRLIFISVSCLLIAFFSALIIGDFLLSIKQIFQVLTPFIDKDKTAVFIILELRLPRFICGVLAGAALGMAGTIVQSITRNPLASPSLMGVSSGAAFAIVVSITLFNFSNSSMLIFGTLGGFIAALLTFAIAWKTHLNPIHLTLAGMSISLFFMAGITVLLVSVSADINGIYYWLTGSLSNRTWQHVYQLLPYVMIGLVLGMSFARPLNLLMLDDFSSRSLGLPIHWWRLALGLVAVILTAATVAAAGPIAFIGLVSPHIVRLSIPNKVANNHRILLPLSALVGAALIAMADIVAKLQTIPVGILCILLGGPLFLYLIRKQAFS